MIQVLKRAHEVLDYLSTNEATAMEISEALDLNRATVHRIIKSLQDLDMVSTGSKAHTYSIGLETYRIGMSFKSKYDQEQMIRKQLEDLGRETQLNAGLAVVNGLDIVSLYEVDQYSVVKFYQEGTKYPFNAGSYGKSIGAYLFDKASLTENFSKIYLKESDELPMDPEALDAVYESIRQRGYSISRGENIKGTKGYAVPIFNNKQEVIASVSLVGLEHYMKDEDTEITIEIMKRYASKLSSILS
ncbi:IclR family transcriptional regulator [Acidaminobacter sp. JC074]|uniref:IclR family transcriptional regulator n=1 Tax=Acidaminobacter sp. JC074 TaxID=2530199 RepID=UPI001F0E84A7|nr:IclR family transcriptional regulator [Acidaminobacter sp. JC074]MCH4886305.1 IclR family transcriptional regulator [Acidaminobacter sp. JC074]